jgi:hypothetical protein
MITNLKTPAPPARDARDNSGDDREKRFELDGFGETALPPKLMALTKSVNRQLCENVEVIVGRDGCFLYWDERHPEMVTQMEYVTGKVGREALEAWVAVAWDIEAGKEKRREHNRLYELLPSKEYELPLTRTQAFALVAACYCYARGAAVCEQSAFAEEIDALLE